VLAGVAHIEKEQASTIRQLKGEEHDGTGGHAQVLSGKSGGVRRELPHDKPNEKV